MDLINTQKMECITIIFISALFIDCGHKFWLHIEILHTLQHKNILHIAYLEWAGKNFNRHISDRDTISNLQSGVLARCPLVSPSHPLMQFQFQRLPSHPATAVIGFNETSLLLGEETW